MSGTEWLVEAYGCPPAALADLPTLATLLDRIVADLGLTPVGDPRWHQFPSPGGITGLVLLAESHLTVHTWPEHGSLCLNLFCCTPRPTWDFAAGLAEGVGAERVAVRVVERNYEGPSVAGVAGVTPHALRAARGCNGEPRHDAAAAAGAGTPSLPDPPSRYTPSPAEGGAGSHPLARPQGVAGSHPLHP